LFTSTVRAQDEQPADTGGQQEEAPPPRRHAAPPPEAPPPAEEAPPVEAKPAPPPPTGIQVVEFRGWKFGVEGRLNAFFVYGWGNHTPLYTPESGGGIVPGIGTGTSADNQIDVNGNFHTPRVRSGFVPNVLAFNFTKNLTETTTLSGHFALWADIHTNLSVYITPQTYLQEGFLKLDGGWGSLIAGRQLALFNRGAIEIDFNYAHNFGVGWPCNFNYVGPACGQIGYGALFPFFRAGLVYATPSLGGFQLTAGIFDPTILAGKWERVIMPTVEGEAAFTKPFGRGGLVKFMVSGLVQKLGGFKPYVDPTPTMPFTPCDGTICTKTVTQWGVAPSFRFELGPLRLGVTGHYGAGLGFNYAQENSQAAVYFASDPHDPHDGDLRTFRGLYGQLAGVFGNMMISAGVGVSQLVALPQDDTSTATMNAEPKQNRGINLVFNYHIFDNFIWDIDGFQSVSSWYGTAVTQTVYVVSTGPTLLF
jgi:hypothetical protein